MIGSLANLIKAKKKGEFILFLGAGASIQSGGPTTEAIVDDVVRRFGDATRAGGPGKYTEFYDILENRMARGDRQAVFREYFEHMDPSDGYMKLGELIKRGWFDVILTTNFDNMPERAFTELKLALGSDYDRFVAGRDNDDEIGFFLRTPHPRIKLVKLHGDLGAGILDFTPLETLRFPPPLEENLRKLTRSNMLFMGYSGRDKSVLGVLNTEGNGIWWANLSGLHWADRDQRKILSILLKRKSDGNIIGGDQGRFDNLVDALFACL